MVTAIVIPIICIYFYWVTRREIREQNKKWNDLSHCVEEAIVTGTITNVHKEKQRFYYNRYIQIIELTIKTDFKIIKVKKVLPLKKQVNTDHFCIGDHVRLYGNWHSGYFRFNRSEKIETVN